MDGSSSACVAGPPYVAINGFRGWTTLDASCGRTGNPRLPGRRTGLSIWGKKGVNTLTRKSRAAYRAPGGGPGRSARGRGRGTVSPAWCVHGGSELDRELEGDRGPLAGWARHTDHPAQRLHAVREAEDSGPLGRVRSSDTVVADGEVQLLAAYLEADVRDRRARVLGRVRERLGDHVVRRGFDRCRQ